MTLYYIIPFLLILKLVVTYLKPTAGSLDDDDHTAEKEHLIDTTYSHKSMNAFDGLFGGFT
jgi:hypothetical protein